MQVLDTWYYLLVKLLSPIFLDSFFFDDIAEKRTSISVFHDQVDFSRSLDYFIQLNDVGMSNFFQDLDLLGELVYCILCPQSAFVNNFDSNMFPSDQMCTQSNFTEATPTKNFTDYVILDHWLEGIRTIVFIQSMLLLILVLRWEQIEVWNVEVFCQLSKLEGLLVLLTSDDIFAPFESRVGAVKPIIIYQLQFELAYVLKIFLDDDLQLAGIVLVQRIKEFSILFTPFVFLQRDESNHFNFVIFEQFLKQISCDIACGSENGYFEFDLFWFDSLINFITQIFTLIRLVPKIEIIKAWYSETTKWLRNRANFVFSWLGRWLWWTVEKADKAIHQGLIKFADRWKI